MLCNSYRQWASVIIHLQLPAGCTWVARASGQTFIFSWVALATSGSCQNAFIIIWLRGFGLPAGSQTHQDDFVLVVLGQLPVDGEVIWKWGVCAAILIWTRTTAVRHEKICSIFRVMDAGARFSLSTVHSVSVIYGGVFCNSRCLFI